MQANEHIRYLRFAVCGIFQHSGGNVDSYNSSISWDMLRGMGMARRYMTEARRFCWTVTFHDALDDEWEKHC